MKKRLHINLLTPTPSQRVLLHALFWLLLLMVRLYLTVITFNVYTGFPVQTIWILNMSGTALIAGVYYFSVIVISRLLKDRRWLWALLAALAVVFLYTLADTTVERLLVHQCVPCLTELQTQQPAYYALIQKELLNVVLIRMLSLGTPFLLLLNLTIPLSIKMALHSWRNQVRALELAKSNIQLEFNFLKSQINPHFLFNTMNNIYGLIMARENERSAALVARLSAVLRYMLYESNRDRMPAAREMQLISDFIELEKIRLNEVSVTSEIRIHSSAPPLPPLLLVPLIENAFKFCRDEKGASIGISIVFNNNVMICKIDNDIDPGRATLENGGGIGLSNLKKRLDLYFPRRYRYATHTTAGCYHVQLDIDLS